MKLNRSFGYIIVIFITLTFIPEYGTALTTDTITASKDSYVDSLYPDDNFGSDLTLMCGNYKRVSPPPLRQYWTYIYFPLFSIDPTWEDVFLKLTAFAVNDPMNLECGVVNEYFNESSITWNTRPLDITFIAKSLNFTSGGMYLFNISSIISRSDMEFCIFLYDQDIDDELTLSLYSREVPDPEERPVLIFYYSSSESSAISSYPLLIIGLISIISIIILTYRIRNYRDIS